MSNQDFFSLQVSHLQCHAHPSSLPSLCYLALKKKKIDKLHIAVQVLNSHQFKKAAFL